MNSCFLDEDNKWNGSVAKDVSGAVARFLDELRLTLKVSRNFLLSELE